LRSHSTVHRFPLLFIPNVTTAPQLPTPSLHDALPTSLGHAAGIDEGAFHFVGRKAGARFLQLLPQRLRGVLQGRQHAEHRRWLRSEEHTSELQSRENLVCRLLLEKKHYSIR